MDNSLAVRMVDALLEILKDPGMSPHLKAQAADALLRAAGLILRAPVEVA